MFKMCDHLGAKPNDFYKELADFIGDPARVKAAPKLPKRKPDLRVVAIRSEASADKEQGE